MVLTASDSTQFALEGDQVVEQAELSLFTHFLLHGLTSGDADLNNDGQVSLDELYDYTYAQVVSQTPRQTPCKWSYNQQGDLIIAKSPRPVVVKPAELPVELREALENPYSSVRLGAVEALRRMLASSEIATALAAKLALERLQNDDSRSVSEAAARLLAEAHHAEAGLPHALQADAVITPIPAPTQSPPPETVKAAAPEAARKPVRKKQQTAAPVPTLEEPRLETLQPPATKAARPSTGQAVRFWSGWVAALLAGAILFSIELTDIRSINPDYPLLTVLSGSLIGGLTGVLQWWMLRRRVAWAGRWLALNTGIGIAIGVAANFTYYLWDGLFDYTLMIVWAGFNLIAGAVRAQREIQWAPVDAQAAGAGPLPALRDWRVWLQWVGAPIGVMVMYVLGYEGVVRNNSEFESFIFPLLMISGGVCAMLQWSLLSRFREHTFAWVPLNILALGVAPFVAPYNTDLQRIILLTWLAANLTIFVMLAGGQPKPQPAARSRLTPLVFGLVWVGMLLVGFGLIILIKTIIDNTSGDYTPGGDFAILMLVGAVIGLGQWLALRKALPGWGWWVVANALFLGWTGYALGTDSSPTAIGAGMAILYWLANLLLGPFMWFLKTRAQKALQNADS